MPVVGFRAQARRHRPISEPCRRVWRWPEGSQASSRGSNVAIEYRYAENQKDRLPALVAQLAWHPVAVPGGEQRYRRTAGHKSGNDDGADRLGEPAPIRSKDGLVASLNRPGGNITGVSWPSAAQVGAKRLELLRQIVPQDDDDLAMLFEDLSQVRRTEAEPNRRAGSGPEQPRSANYIIIQHQQRPRHADGHRPPSFNARGRRAAESSAESAFLDLEAGKQLSRWRRAMPYPRCISCASFVAAGGLCRATAPTLPTRRQAGDLCRRILKGAKPADLPVQQPTKFELVINLKTAKALGLTVPPTLLARADEVIE